MDKADMIANGDRPVVQQGPSPNTIQIVYPSGECKVMSEQTAMTLFAELMRVVTGEPLDCQ